MKKIIGYSIFAILLMALAVAMAIDTGDWWAPFAVFGGVALLMGIIKVAVDLITDES